MKINILNPDREIDLMVYNIYNKLFLDDKNRIHYANIPYYTLSMSRYFEFIKLLLDKYKIEICINYLIEMRPDMPKGWHCCIYELYNDDIFNNMIHIFGEELPAKAFCKAIIKWDVINEYSKNIKLD